MAAPRGPAGLPRVLAILVRPGLTWDDIAAAPRAPRRLFLGHVIPLAAIPAVCGVAGGAVFGFNIASVGVRVSHAGLLLGAVVGYAATLVGVWLLARWIDLVATLSRGRRDRQAAVNLVAYAGTASWIGGVGELYPSVGIPVSILAGLYSLYLLYLGMPKLMRIPESRRLTAFALVLAVTVLLGGMRGALVGSAADLGGPLSASHAPR